MVKRPQQSKADSDDEKVIKAISSGDRRLLLDLLQEGPKTTGQLCAELPWLNRCTVMQHISVLEKANLLIAKKRGRERWNYLDISPIQQFSERWIKPYAAPSARMLTKLKADIEAN